MRYYKGITRVLCLTAVMTGIAGFPANAMENNTKEELIIQESSFPDENFRNYVEDNVDSDNNGSLSEEELNNCKSMNLYQKEIENLQGIGQFKYLTTLNCAKNKLTELDVSGCSSLKKLDCSRNQIKNLNINGQLELLYCSENEMEEFAPEQAENLIYLDCSTNQLTRLELAGAPELKEIYCGKNPITNLDFSLTPEIAMINCAESLVPTLNLQGCQSLEMLDCGNAELESLDVSSCTSLHTLYCQNNALKTLKLDNCTVLNTLFCENNKLEKLDISSCQGLIHVNCENNQIETELDFSDFSMLSTVSCSSNKIPEIQVKNCRELYQLSCCNNEIKELNLEDAPLLNQEPDTEEYDGVTKRIYHVICDAKVKVLGVAEEYIQRMGAAEPTKEPDKKPGVTQTPQNPVYSITYKLNGGKNHSKNAGTYNGNHMKLYHPARSGYVFEGWYLEASFRTKVSEIKGNGKGDITLFAKWKKVSTARVKLTSVKSTKPAKMKLRYKKVSGAKGYQISYARNKKFQKAKKITTRKTSYSVSRLKKGRTYYVKVRAYKYDSRNKKIYGKYSKVRKVIIKK